MKVLDLPVTAPISAYPGSTSKQGVGLVQGCSLTTLGHTGPVWNSSLGSCGHLPVTAGTCLHSLISPMVTGAGSRLLCMPLVMGQSAEWSRGIWGKMHDCFGHETSR